MFLIDLRQLMYVDEPASSSRDTFAVFNYFNKITFSFFNIEYSRRQDVNQARPNFEFMNLYNILNFMRILRC